MHPILHQKNDANTIKKLQSNLEDHEKRISETEKNLEELKSKQFTIRLREKSLDAISDKK